MQALDLAIVLTGDDSPDGVMGILNAMSLQVGSSATVECRRLLRKHPVRTWNALSVPRIPSRQPPALQHLASLSLPDGQHRSLDGNLGGEEYPQAEIPLQPPANMPLLRRLHFGGHRIWDALHKALWPLVVLAAQGAPEHAVVGGPASADAADATSSPHSSPPGALLVLFCVQMLACSKTGVQLSNE